MGVLRVHGVRRTCPGQKPGRASRRARVAPGVRGRGRGPREDDDERDDRVLPDRLGRDPAWLIGGDIPQLGGNAGIGDGWLVVEGDESDRTVEALRPRIAVITNVDLDHHSTFASRAEVVELFDRWLEHVPTVVRGMD